MFHDLWSNDDNRKNEVATRLMAGEYAWLEEGRLDVGLTAESFKTQFVTQLQTREPKVAAGG
jgi:hypothetical protein